MRNPLHEVQKGLRSLAKRYKQISYSAGLAVLFLMLGTSAFSRDTQTILTREDINNSISGMQGKFQTLRRENEKHLDGAQLRLVQLMEQGDQVVKSPWASWQFGLNYFYGDYRKTYKGRGDKQDKYPYEGVLKRDDNEMNRYISLDSKFYGTLPVSTDVKSASTNGRGGQNSPYLSYGLAGTKLVKEPIVGFELSAGVTPKFVSKEPLNLTPPLPAVPAEPTLPKAINFKPADPKISAPEAPIVNPPTIVAPATGNGDEQWLKTGGSVAPLSQLNMEGGTLNVTGKGSRYDVESKDVKFVGEVGSAHTKYYYTAISPTNIGSANTTGPAVPLSFKFENQSQYAAMKLVGGHEINIDDVIINYTGEGSSNYQRWLFHTDGHNNQGDSTWVIGQGTKVNIEGKNLVLYTSQYHSGTGQNANIGFVNRGTISTKGENNIGWIAMADGGNLNRQMFFHNDTSGNISLEGKGDIFTYMDTDGVAVNGGWSLINDGTLKLIGDKQYGLVVDQKRSYAASELLFNKPMEIRGKESVGVAFKGWTELGGGIAYSRSTANNIVTTLPAVSRESVLNFDLQGSKNIGLYFENSGTKDFTVKDLTVNSSGEKNTAIFVKNGQVSISDKNAAGRDNSINLNGGKDSIGIFAAAANKTLTTGAKITSTNSDSAVGIYAKSAGNVTNTGDISVNGKSVKAIIAEGTVVSSSGKIDVSGTALSNTDGSVGLVSMNGGTLTSTGKSNIVVEGSASVGLFADKGKLVVADATVETKAGSFNTYAKGVNGVIEFGPNSKIITGQKSLAFYTDADGVIKFTAPTVATIEGGLDPNTRGTAFLYKGTGYSTFDSNAVNTWAANRFGGTLNNLTLNMQAGSRMFIAQDVSMNLSGTNATNLFSGTGTTVNGNDYKSFMLYLSKLALDQNINLDNSTDAYNRLEVSNSSIENNNNNNIVGTQAGQVAIAQENDPANPTSVVQLVNKGTINLSGANSTAIYGKNAELLNDSTGSIKLGESSTALYGLAGSKIENKGKIDAGLKSTALYGKASTLLNDATGEITVGDAATALYGLEDSTVDNKGKISLGEGATALYSKDAIASSLRAMSNSGTIEGTKDRAMAMVYEGTNPAAGGAVTTPTGMKNTATGKISLTGNSSIGMYGLGSDYEMVNEGEITVGSAPSANQPSVGMFASTDSLHITNTATGKIAAGDNSIGIFGYEVGNYGDIKVGDNAIGIYSKGPQVELDPGSKITVGNKQTVGVYLENGGILNNNGDMEIGEDSFGIVANPGATPFNYTGSASSNVTLGKDSIYLYSTDKNGTVNNATNLVSASAGGNYGIYSAGTITNSGNMDFSNGIGNVGILTHLGGVATNTGSIKVGASNVDDKKYSIGMASTEGEIINNATIDVLGEKSIGMYGAGKNTVVRNAGTINLAADGTMGIYLDEGAKGYNTGTITTVGQPKEVVGVVVRKGSVLENHGNITINSDKGYAGLKLNGGIIKNYGTMTLNGTSSTDEDGGKTVYDPSDQDTGKKVGTVEIKAPGKVKGTADIYENGKLVTPASVSSPLSSEEVAKINAKPEIIGSSLHDLTPRNPMLASGIGMYVDTLVGTNPIQGLNTLANDSADLIIGSEAARVTNSKFIHVHGDILKPYQDTMLNNPQIQNWDIYSGSLTWMSTVTLDPNTGVLGNVYLTKMPYTAFSNDTDTYNFTDGLEQLYGREGLDSREKTVFNKLNSIGNNEETLLYQAYDEMMGHQYANVQQRIHATGGILDKEFRYLRREWTNMSKDSNKVKAFGMNGEYRTSTAGIIDYTNYAQGLAYVHEDETVKLGESSGWYTGFVRNYFKFKDIGQSREEMYQGKLGYFRNFAFDDDGSLQWHIAGEGFLGHSKLNRRYLVVDEIFRAKSKFWSYGLGLKNEVSKEFRLSEDFKLRPYAMLDLTYGRFQKIRERSGEVRLEVKANDYYSIRPEVGVELAHKFAFGKRNLLKTTIGVAYENELGKVGEVKNKARVAYTTADHFGLRGEKEDRRGNIKADLKLGLENTSYGVTANIGYDTKGSNIRAGLGLRVIF